MSNPQAVVAVFGAILLAIVMYPFYVVLSGGDVPTGFINAIPDLVAPLAIMTVFAVGILAVLGRS